MGDSCREHRTQKRADRRLRIHPLVSYPRRSTLQFAIVLAAPSTPPTECLALHRHRAADNRILAGISGKLVGIYRQAPARLITTPRLDVPRALGIHPLEI